MGIEQMGRLPGFLETRERNYDLLAEGLGQIEELELLDSGHDGELHASHYCLVAILREPLAARREEIIDALKAEGIGTSVYYPKSVPDMNYYREKYGYAQGSCPVATRISTESIAFPCAPHVTETDIERIVDGVKRVLSEVGSDG